MRFIRLSLLVHERSIISSEFPEVHFCLLVSYSDMRNLTYGPL